MGKLPHIVAGYSDGTVRMFDVNKVEMILKMHPHAVAVTAISFSSDGRSIDVLSSAWRMLINFNNSLFRMEFSGSSYHTLVTLCEYFELNKLSGIQKS